MVASFSSDEEAKHFGAGMANFMGEDGMAKYFGVEWQEIWGGWVRCQIFCQVSLGVGWQIFWGRVAWKNILGWSGKKLGRRQQIFGGRKQKKFGRWGGKKKLEGWDAIWGRGWGDKIFWGWVSKHFGGGVAYFLLTSNFSHPHAAPSTTTICPWYFNISACLPNESSVGSFTLPDIFFNYFTLLSEIEVWCLEVFRHSRHVLSCAHVTYF